MRNGKWSQNKLNLRTLTSKNQQVNIFQGIFINGNKVPYVDTHIVGEHNGLNNGNIWLM